MSSVEKEVTNRSNVVITSNKKKFQISYAHITSWSHRVANREFEPGFLKIPKNSVDQFITKM